MKKILVGVITAVVVVASVVIFNGCKKEATVFDTPEKQMPPMGETGDLIGWNVFTVDDYTTSSESFCEERGSGCLPNVNITFICKACQEPGFKPPAGAIEVYESIGGTTGGDPTGIIGKLVIHKLLIDLKSLSAAERPMFVQEKRDYFVEIIEENLINNVISGKYNISAITEQTTRTNMFRYLIYFTKMIEVDGETTEELVTVVPISYIYELN